MRSRRGVVVAGAVLTALLGVGAVRCPLPYAVLDAGPTVDTLGGQVITVSGAPVSVSAGQLRLTTVRAETGIGLREAVAAWRDDDRALVPLEVVRPGGQTDQQTDRLNRESFAASQRSAELAARRELGAGTPFTVTFDLDGIGGPSAGLMFTLGLIDKLSPADLTGGRIIAGTGTVDDSGAVGPIGGLPQKLDGAAAAGARLFLVPAGECAEAEANAVPGLTMARVATVGEALTALRVFAAGGTPTPC